MDSRLREMKLSTLLKMLEVSCANTKFDSLVERALFEKFISELVIKIRSNNEKATPYTNVTHYKFPVSYELNTPENFYSVAEKDCIDQCFDALYNFKIKPSKGWKNKYVAF
jgi:hypothetical protein